MKKIKKILSTVLLLTAIAGAKAEACTPSQYLESARKYYNNPNLQYEDLYDSLSWVGFIEEAPIPDRYVVPNEYLPQTGENIDFTTLYLGGGILVIGLIACMKRR